MQDDMGSSNIMEGFPARGASRAVQAKNAIKYLWHFLCHTMQTMHNDYIVLGGNGLVHLEVASFAM